MPRKILKYASITLATYFPSINHISLATCRYNIRADKNIVNKQAIFSGCRYTLDRLVVVETSYDTTA
jgi:hypothetical protein